MRTELEKIREWADSKIASESEPPWAWYQYMKLRETLDAILGGMDAVSPTGSLLQSEEHSGNGLRLAASNDQPDVARHRRFAKRLRLPT